MLPAGSSSRFSPAGPRGSRRCRRQRPADSAVAFGGGPGRGVRFDAIAPQSGGGRLASQRNRRRQSVRLLFAGHCQVPMRFRGYNHGRFTRAHHGQPAGSFQGSCSALHVASRPVYPRPGTRFRPAQIHSIALLETAATVTLRSLDGHPPTLVAGQKLGKRITADGASPVGSTLFDNGGLVPRQLTRRKLLLLLHGKSC